MNITTVGHIKDECWHCGKQIDSNVLPVYLLMGLRNGKSLHINQTSTCCSAQAYDPTWATDESNKNLWGEVPKQLSLEQIQLLMGMCRTMITVNTPLDPGSVKRWTDVLNVLDSQLGS